MNQFAFRQLSLTGLALFLLSALIAALQQKNGIKETNNGMLVESSDGGNFTCKGTVREVFECTYTNTLHHDGGYEGIGSRTTSNNPGLGTSYITNADGINYVQTITSNAAGATVINIHTSEGYF